jgi:hypothetical protein
MPSDPYFVSGLRLAVGSINAGPGSAAFALYQGGSTGDFSGCTLLSTFGSNTHSDTVAWDYLPLDTPVLVDPADGPLWIMWAHVAGDFGMPFTWTFLTPTGSADNQDFQLSGNDCSFLMTAGTSFGDPTNFPATMGTVDSGEFGMPPFALTFMETPIQNDLVVVGRMGTRVTDPLTDFTGTSGLPLLVANSYNTPNILGMEVLEAGVAYRTHTLGSNYRLSLGTGGAADDDFQGAVFADIGEAGVGTTDTGWNDVTAPAGVTLAPSSRIWLALEFDGSGSELAYDPAGPEDFSPATLPAAYYNGNTTEAEIDDGSLGGTQSTNIDFDPTTPFTGTMAYDGSLYSNDNNVG